ncbi:MAG: hypothetical protein HF976_05185 [ANME-2 cluster archaeon]|nr:hypothetical protein [ANME-2 cluster archaeon]MBC2700800.1 hypothetical protein [ANME-2 cluster archaeon]MBC2707549.1 hypothetical protein [ANME-2 cluster archaeon]MBC2745876.1 hypothetical protein [ANME-2 cluster archaeon]MBC2764067.1 hypothetical protein [ANME-2 cluster archaeon]
MVCALRVLGGSKFTRIHKVGCHLPPYRAAVAGNAEKWVTIGQSLIVVSI